MSGNTNPNVVTDGLVLCLDAGNDESYANSGVIPPKSESIAEPWQNYTGSISNASDFWTIIGDDGVLLDDGTVDWVGKFDSQIPSTGYWTVSFEHQSTSTGRLGIVGGGASSAYDGLFTTTTTKQIHTETNYISSTEELRFYIRHDLGGDITISNFRFYKSDSSGNSLVWHDLGGNEYDATLVNGPTITSTGLELDGANDYISLAHGGNLSFSSGSFTISVWHNYSGGTGYGGIITNDSNGDLAWKIKKDTGQAYFRAKSSYGSGNEATFPAYTLDTFHHYAYTVTSSLMQLYFNGVAGNSVSNPGSPTAYNNIAFGSYRYDDAGNGSYLNNQTIGITLLYNRALTATEILQNYNAHKARYGL